MEIVEDWLKIGVWRENFGVNVPREGAQRGTLEELKTVKVTGFNVAR